MTYLNAEQTQIAKEAAREHQELERRQDLTVLQLMMDTPVDKLAEKAAEIGLPWGEYLHLISKYKHVLKRYEEENK